MKYSYKLTVTDETKDEDILKMEGFGSTRSKETCLKGIRREIISVIRECLTPKDSEE